MVKHVLPILLSVCKNLLQRSKEVYDAPLIDNEDWYVTRNVTRNEYNMSHFNTGTISYVKFINNTPVIRVTYLKNGTTCTNLTICETHHVQAQKVLENLL